MKGERRNGKERGNQRDSTFRSNRPKKHVMHYMTLDQKLALRGYRCSGHVIKWKNPFFIKPKKGHIRGLENKKGLISGRFI